MLDHVSIAVSNLEQAAPFYDAIFATLGVPCVWREPAAIGYGRRNSATDDSHTYLTVRAVPAGTGTLALHAPGRHWCFRAASRAAVDAFHAAGLNAGGTCHGPPGLRPAYHEAYYAAFLCDPDGNIVEAVCHRPP